MALSFALITPLNLLIKRRYVARCSGTICSGDSWAHQLDVLFARSGPSSENGRESIQGWLREGTSRVAEGSETEIAEWVRCPPPLRWTGSTTSSLFDDAFRRVAKGKIRESCRIQRPKSFVNIDDPKIEKQTDVIIRLTTTNICGSDLHMYEGRTSFEKAGSSAMALARSSKSLP